MKQSINWKTFSQTNSFYKNFQNLSFNLFIYAKYEWINTSMDKSEDNLVSFRLIWKIYQFIDFSFRLYSGWINSNKIALDENEKIVTPNLWKISLSITLDNLVIPYWIPPRHRRRLSSRINNILIILISDPEKPDIHFLAIDGSGIFFNDQIQNIQSFVAGNRIQFRSSLFVVKENKKSKDHG